MLKIKFTEDSVNGGVRGAEGYISNEPIYGDVFQLYAIVDTIKPEYKDTFVHYVTSINGENVDVAPFNTEVNYKFEFVN